MLQEGLSKHTEGKQCLSHTDQCNHHPGEGGADYVVIKGERKRRREGRERARERLKQWHYDVMQRDATKARKGAILCADDRLNREVV